MATAINIYLMMWVITYFICYLRTISQNPGFNPVMFGIIGLTWWMYWVLFAMDIVIKVSFVVSKVIALMFNRK